MVKASPGVDRMAQDFNEVDNPSDAWIADLKGQIRSKYLERKGLMWEDIAADTGISLPTVRAVMRENNIRHTVKTLLTLAAYFDIRVAFIEGLKSKPQPQELPKFTKRELKWIADQILKSAKKPAE